MVNFDEIFYVTNVVGKNPLGCFFLIGRIVNFHFWNFSTSGSTAISGFPEIRKLRISAGCTPPNLETYFFGSIHP
jgi:hypothetical protein